MFSLAYLQIVLRSPRPAVLLGGDRSFSDIAQMLSSPPSAASSLGRLLSFPLGARPLVSRPPGSPGAGIEGISRTNLLRRRMISSQVGKEGVEAPSCSFYRFVTEPSRLFWVPTRSIGVIMQTTPQTGRVKQAQMTIIDYDDEVEKACHHSMVYPWLTTEWEEAGWEASHKPARSIAPARSSVDGQISWQKALSAGETLGMTVCNCPLRDSVKTG